MSENLKIYEAVREVPQEAQKTITGGKLNGFTDINPMWRIKALTEQFGPCGIGWYPEILKQWIEPGPDGRIAAFCNINLYVKIGEEWSKPINGTGGSMLTNIEDGKQRTSDECYKMAFTDAISVSCKMLGFGADIYWQKDKTKYDGKQGDDEPLKPQVSPVKTERNPESQEPYECEVCGNTITWKVHEYSIGKYGRSLCYNCQKRQ
jgi:hypothetical protein